MNNIRILAAALLLAPALFSQPQSTPLQALNSGDFFIISSVDLAKRQLLLKLPTEVTELMGVDNRTAYFDERGRPIKLNDLRAGDTVYITSATSGERPLALTIRKGPMTQEVLRQRYLTRRK